MWHRSVLHPPIVLLLIALLYSATIILQQMSMPDIPSDSDESVRNGIRPSSKLGWSVLANITKKSHSSNTPENIALKSYLIDVISQINRTTCGNIELSTEQANVVVNPGQRHVYFQADNLVVRIRGQQKAALLISSHFDSALHAKGGTDAGMGVASMVTVLQALSRSNCESPALYSVIFNLNNSEEDYLLGASAFTKHSWFKEIKAFINLEGTGTAPNRKSALFRTNSLEMTKLILSTSPYPHASVIFNVAMKFIAR